MGGGSRNNKQKGDRQMEVPTLKEVVEQDGSGSPLEANSVGSVDPKHRLLDYI